MKKRRVINRVVLGIDVTEYLAMKYGFVCKFDNDNSTVYSFNVKESPVNKLEDESRSFYNISSLSIKNIIGNDNYKFPILTPVSIDNFYEDGKLIYSNILN